MIGDLPLLIGNLPLLIGDFLLLPTVLLDLIGQDEAVHGQRGKDVAYIDERKDVDEQRYDHRDRDRQYGDEEGKKDFAGKPLPAL